MIRLLNLSEIETNNYDRPAYPALVGSAYSGRALDLFMGNIGHGAPNDVFDLFGAPFGFMYLLWLPVVLFAYSKRPLLQFIAFVLVLIHGIGMIFVLRSNANNAAEYLKIQIGDSAFGPALWIVGCWMALSGAMVRRIVVTKLWKRVPDIESWRV